ncbi:hypothetical protein ACH5RR_002819 [Cinchona calisaya]|uniref:Uncharacterized protein n=1 Tax=Cinchona calisaya TaxID=153742 RepID=A0ABD3AT67_9GENT
MRNFDLNKSPLPEDKDKKKRKQKGKEKRTDHHQSDEDRPKKKMKKDSSSQETKKKMKKNSSPSSSSSSSSSNSRNWGVHANFKKFIEDQFKEKNIIGKQTLVMEKRLSTTDVRKRLIMYPLLFTHNPKFLEVEEDQRLIKSKGRKRGVRGKEDIPVTLIGPKHNRRDEVNLGMRKGQSKNPNASLNYVLTSKEWKHIAKENNLRAGEIVQLWSVRVKEELWFVLLKENSDGYRSKQSYNLK